jgi:uncharacterized protein (TIGR03067 family)
MFLVLAVLSGFVLTITGSMGVAAPVPKHLMKETENTDQARLQGTWKLESLSIGGMPPAAYNFETTYEIHGDKLTMRSEKHTATAIIKLDVVDGLKRLTMTSLKQVDPDGKPGEQLDDMIFGYTVAGDTFLLATRPAKDTGKTSEPVDPNKPGSEGVVRVFTRAKDKN